MSNYGKLWQDADDIRRKLIELVPATTSEPRMNRLENAIREVAQHTARLQELLAMWASLEREMAKEPSE